MLLFRAEEHIDRWCNHWSQPRGGVLTIDQAWQLARAWYQLKRDPDWRRPTLPEAELLLGQLGLTGAFWSLR